MSMTEGAAFLPADEGDLSATGKVIQVIEDLCSVELLEDFLMIAFNITVPIQPSAFVGV